MIDARFAQHFAEDWVAAWNSHDLDRVLFHYADDFEMASPYIAALAGEPGGKLKGKPAVRAYWAKALGLMPDLRFELVAVLPGVDSVVIYYRGVRGTAAEVFCFDEAGRVVKARAHYAAG
ncbi:nuclear transport factor 2 family protein [Methylomagnum sp.]